MIKKVLFTEWLSKFNIKISKKRIKNNLNFLLDPFFRMDSGFGSGSRSASNEMGP